MNPLTILRCVAVLAAAAICSSALAEAPRLPSTTVRVSDLNLASAAGISTLYKRIKRAAAWVCAKPQGAERLVLESDRRACEADTTDHTIAGLNLPALHAVHYEQSGRRVGSGGYARQ